MVASELPCVPASALAGTDTMPERDAFALLPASWYVIGSSRELDRGPIGVTVLNVSLVAWRRKRDGVVAVMSGQCSHLGAELKRGRVVEDCIECPFHAWRYDSSGQCAHIPRAKRIPPEARQRVYPAAERNGLVFFFNGPDPLFPLPDFDGEAGENSSTGTLVEFTVPFDWFLATAHAFDAQHFEIAHGRELEAPIEVDAPHPLARRSTYTARIVGKAWFDQLLKHVMGPRVRTSITVWGGTLALITATFARRTSRFMIATRPLEGGKTLCQVAVFAPRSRSTLGRALVQPLSLWIRRRVTRAYVVGEVEKLGTTRYSPKSLIEADAELSAFFRWAAGLPGSRNAHCPPKGAPL